VPNSILDSGGALVWSQLYLACTRPLRYLGALAFVAGRGGIHPWLDWFQAGGLARRLLRDGVDHLHAHFATAPAAVAELVHRLIGLPYSLTAHAKDIYVTPRDELTRKMHEARFVVTCTDYNHRYLQDLVANGTPLHRVYHGLDAQWFEHERFEHEPAASADSSDESPLILAVGRFRAKKGLGDLVEACRLLADRGVDFRCELVGFGPLREQLVQQVKDLGLADRVAIVGPLGQEAVKQRYRRAAVMALPCQVAADGDRDGIPNVLMEAMAMGVPVVSTPVSGIPELIEDGVTGLLVPQRDPAALADALARLLDDRALRARICEAAARRVRRAFDVAGNCEALRELFQSASAAP
jgi:glycosyltransferase involved in cell wall biosynthesis